MAVGAGPRDIRRQFLAEAMLISLIDGEIPQKRRPGNPGRPR